MKKLLSILGSVGMVGMTSATVVSCKNPNSGKKSPDVKGQLSQKVNEVKKKKETLEKEHRGKWFDGPKAVKEKLVSVLNNATAALDKADLTSDEVTTITNELQTAITNFESSLPKNIISKVINEQGDIKDLFSKDWTYATAFNKDGGDKEEQQQRILDYFYDSVMTSASAKEHGYSSEELTEFRDYLLGWSQTNVKLVYIHADDEDKQEVYRDYVVTDKNKTKTLEEWFLEQAQDEFPEEDVKTKEFWTKHSKLSLGIQFQKNAAGSELNKDTKDFWTFTFAENTPLKENQKKIEGIVEEIAVENKGVVLPIKKGIQSDEELKNEVEGAFKKIFYGKLFIPKNIVLEFGKLPTLVEINKAKNGEWTSGKDVKITFKEKLEDSRIEKVVEIKTQYSTEWAK